VTFIAGLGEALAQTKHFHAIHPDSMYKYDGFFHAAKIPKKNRSLKLFLGIHWDIGSAQQRQA
jgi:hypothetical protein